MEEKIPDMFLVGCNYWASNAGVHMWSEWDEAVVDDDLKRLSENGVKILRVFPNWKDFQPVIPLYRGKGDHYYKYCMENDKEAENEYFLDEEMLSRFDKFCRICEKYNLKIIVGLLTGWMSGRLFIPQVLNDKNLYTDSLALWFEERFVRGFVKRFKDDKVICGWNPGNECNMLSHAADRNAARVWLAFISNTIRSVDNSHPVISGMHSLAVETKWDDDNTNWILYDQKDHVDMLTTHPYAFFVPHCLIDGIGEMRTLLHATCESVYYASIGGRPCLVEEIGTLGPSVCDDETAANMIKINLFSNWVHKSKGLLWWCGYDLINVKRPPYIWSAGEGELGMIDKDKNPRPILKEMKKFEDWRVSLDFELPPPQTDGVCIVSHNQDHWGAGYMSYILAKQAGVNLTFAYSGHELPESDVYLLPSIKSAMAIDNLYFEKLYEKVMNGATLYVSNDFGLIFEHEKLLGVHIKDSSFGDRCGAFEFDGTRIEYEKNRNFEISLSGAECLACDGEKPMFTCYKVGKGKVYYLNFGFEVSKLPKSGAFECDDYKIYREVFKDKLKEHVVVCDNREVGVTHHYKDDLCYVSLINYSDKEIKPDIKLNSDYEKEKEIMGTTAVLEPYGTVLVLYRKK